MDAFTDTLKSNRTIESLTIAGMHLEKKSVYNLSQFMSNNFNMRKLSLAWSSVKSTDLMQLMSNIRGIKHLQHLDISNIPFEGPKSLQLTSIFKDHIVLNTSLIHLDMSCCDLDPDELEILVEGMKRSRSLLAVHLSGNSTVGLHDESNGSMSTKDKIFKKLTKKQNVKSLTNLVPSTNISLKNNFKFNSLSSALIPRSEQNHRREQQMKLELYKQNMERKMGLGADIRRNYETINDRVVFYRFLGHLEIKDGQKWKMDTRCWICEKWKYTCVIVNPNTIQNNFKSASEFDPAPYHNKIVKEQTAGFGGMTVINKEPKITGSFCEWKGKEFLKIDKFYDCLLRNSLPTTRYYVETKDSLVSKMAQILNRDIYTMFRNQKSLSKHRKPAAIQRLLKQRQLQIEKMLERERKFREPPTAHKQNDEEVKQPITAKSKTIKAVRKTAIIHKFLNSSK